jgi:hypothetical protein
VWLRAWLRPVASGFIIDLDSISTQEMLKLISEAINNNIEHGVCQAVVCIKHR